MIATAVPSYAAVSVVASSTDPAWTPMTYAGSVEYDYAGDEQATSAESDIVGNVDNKSFFTYFDNNGTSSTTDDILGYRVRVAGEKNPAGFNNVVFVGMDLDQDNTLDLFAGVSFAGSSSVIGLFAAGTGLNSSPGTTTIQGISTTYQDAAVQGVNFDFRAVTAADGGTTTDVDGGEVDYYVSFLIPYADLENFANDLGITISQNTAIGYVLATATQENSLNQDFNGLPKTFDTGTSWKDLGVITTPVTVSGGPAVPEPSSVMLVGLAGVAFLFRRSR